MALATYTFKVPSIVCNGCAKAITDEILTHESAAKVNVDVSAKTVNVETEASEESIKQMIVSVGHTVDWATLPLGHCWHSAPNYKA